MKKADMKSWHIAVSILAVAVFGFLYFQNYIAKIAWAKYRQANAAIFLTKDAALAMQIGNYYFNQAAYDLGRAEKAYRKAVRINPKILWRHYQLARIYFIKGDSEKALDEINKELEANPENLRSLYMRGLIYGYSGELQKAEEDFRRFTMWAPKEWAGYNDLAWVLLKAGKHREAEEALALAFSEVPGADKNSWLLNSLGVAKLNLRKYKEAHSLFEHAKTLSEGLFADDWVAAYPGNDPAEAEGGILAFRRAVEKNLQRARNMK